MSDSASTRGDRPSGKILIADCGSTKVRWVLLDTCGKILLLDFETTGFNAAVTSPEEIRRILRNEVAPKLQSADIDTLHFYGAGCIGGDVNWRLMDMLAEYIPAYWIEVASDLVAAARALFGRGRGIACILGTGSNSGLYDGREIVANTPPLGYILGDEGSGAVLGRRLIGDLFKGLLPAEIVRDFEDEYHLSKADVINMVYRHGPSNRWLASFCPFISAQIGHPEIAALVTEEVRRFLQRNVRRYFTGTASPADTPLGFIGTIAVVFKPQLLDACTCEGLTVKTINRSPIHGLKNYHLCQQA